MYRDTDQTKALTAAGLNLIAQALSIYDQNLRLAVCNAPFQQMFNLPDRLVVPGATFADTIRFIAQSGDYGPIDDIDCYVAEKIEQARAFEPHYIERTRANGQTISVEGSPLPQGGWVTVYTDITATKQQETLLRARSDALSDQLLDHAEKLGQTNRELAAMITALEEAKRQLTLSEARARLTTEMVPAHISHVGPDRRYSYSNRRLSSVIPGKPDNIVGRDIKDVIGDTTFRRISAALDQAFDGTAKVLEFTDAPSAHRIRAAFNPDNKGGVYILSMNVTEETQTREALQQTRKRETAAQLISGLAHDFSNLLTIILGMQSRLARLPDLPEGAQDLIDCTLSAARRGGGLLSTIADMTGPRTLRPVATDPTVLLKELTTLAAPSLPPDVELVVSNDVTAPILIDKGAVQDGLLNLILNARDACGACGRITLTQRQLHDTWIEWSLHDTGPGFSATAIKRGLDPFFSTKGSEGTGLGLSMVFDMAKSAGGELRLANDPAGGARVTMRLPYRVAVPSTTGLVLLVEDADDIRMVVRDMLMDMGHSVIEAASADEASALIADLPDISMVLSDIQLKGDATGSDLAQRIGPGLPLVLMTSLPQDHPLFLRAQAVAPVLRKPFGAADLRALIAPDKGAAQ